MEAEPASERSFYVNVLDDGQSPKKGDCVSETQRDVSRYDRTLPLRDKVRGYGRLSERQFLAYE